MADSSSSSSSSSLLIHEVGLVSEKRNARVRGVLESGLAGNQVLFFAGERREALG